MIGAAGLSGALSNSPRGGGGSAHGGGGGRSKPSSDHQHATRRLHACERSSALNRSPAVCKRPCWASAQVHGSASSGPISRPIARDQYLRFQSTPAVQRTRKSAICWGSSSAG